MLYSIFKLHNLLQIMDSKKHGDDDYSLLVNLKKLDDDPQFSRKISIEKLKKLPHGKLRSSGKRW